MPRAGASSRQGSKCTASGYSRLLASALETFFKALVVVFPRPVRSVPPVAKVKINKTKGKYIFLVEFTHLIFA